MRTLRNLMALLLCAAIGLGCAGLAAAGEETADLTQSFGLPAGGAEPEEKTAELFIPWAEIDPMEWEEELPLQLSAEQQREANLFLSNFSEQGFCGADSEPFDALEARDAVLFAFAHRWAKINRPEAIRLDGEYETMTLELVNGIVARYFDCGRVLEPKEGEDYSVELGMGRYDWDRCWFEGGTFYYPAADGESYPFFTVVERAVGHPSGRAALYFTVYELDIGRYREQDCVPEDYYRLTPGEAEQRAAAWEIQARRTGTALVSPLFLTESGRMSYMLRRYVLDDVPA